MKHSLTPEVAMAIQKGERDYARLLCDIELAQAPKMVAVVIDDENQRQASNHLERRLRGAL